MHLLYKLRTTPGEESLRIHDRMRIRHEAAPKRRQKEWLQLGTEDDIWERNKETTSPDIGKNMH